MSRRALVVDDNEDVRFLVRRALERNGVDVIEAQGGPEALAALEHDALPDVVVLDVQMPDMDGWETLQRIRHNARTADVPVVMCTVKAREEDQERAASLGSDGYITKPFRIESLRGRVARALGADGGS